MIDNQRILGKRRLTGIVIAEETVAPEPPAGTSQPLRRSTWARMTPVAHAFGQNAIYRKDTDASKHRNFLL